MDPIKIAMIAAVSENGIIGRDSDMPWRLSADLKRFKAVTLGCPIICGRKTFQTFGKALPGRLNIVISRMPFEADGITNCHSLSDAIAVAKQTAAKDGKEEIFIVGGGQIYREAIAQADRLFITHINEVIEGDTSFPNIDSQIWTPTSEQSFPAGEKDNYSTRYVIYNRTIT
jgi:dihydrofolate reductase